MDGRAMWFGWWLDGAMNWENIFKTTKKNTKLKCNRTIDCWKPLTITSHLLLAWIVILLLILCLLVLMVLIGLLLVLISTVRLLMITCSGNVAWWRLLLLRLLSARIHLGLKYTNAIIDAFNRFASCLFEVLSAIGVDGVEFEKVLREHLVQVEVLFVLSGGSFEAFNLKDRKTTFLFKYIRKLLLHFKYKTSIARLNCANTAYIL